MKKLKLDFNVEKTQIYYDSIALGYNNLYQEEQIEKINLLKRNFLVSGRILDLGAGSGILNGFINENVELFSVDISKKMLELNNNNFEKKFLSDGFNLPFEDNFFDQIISFTMLQDSKDPIYILNEVKRILKKDKLFVLTFLKINSKNLILEYIENKFETISFYEHEKDYMFVLKNIQ